MTRDGGVFVKCLFIVGVNPVALATRLARPVSVKSENAMINTRCRCRDVSIKLGL